MSSDPGIVEPQGPRKRGRKRWRWVIVLLGGAAAWITFLLTREDDKPSVTLPDGTQIIYFGHSKGVLDPPSQEPRLYTHSKPPQEEHRLQRWWQRQRGSLPGWLVSRLPAWDFHEDNYPGWRDSNELELQFRVIGDLVERPWHIFIADDHGWETRVRDYTWGDDGRFERGAPQKSGWVRLGSAYPRHSKTLRIRFHPGEPMEPKMSPEARSKSFSELVVPNPFYDGPAPAPGGALPITQPFRGGTITLHEVSRDRVVGDNYGSFAATFSLDLAGQSRPGYDIHNLEVTDSSGQHFRRTSGWSTFENNRHVVGTDTAPWSDDPCWTVRFALRREHYGGEAEPHEVFRFEKLPVPTDNPIELNRELTQNGITLRLTTLTAIPPEPGNSARITVEGWAKSDQRLRWIVLHEATDDQGRTEVKSANGDHSWPLLHGPVGGNPNGPTFAVRLPPDAKWWNLSVIPETITTVTFKVKPPVMK